MQTHKLTILPYFRAHKKKCKFNRTCNLYTDLSYTCTHVGGTYCGRYRTLAKAANGFAIKNEDFVEDEIVIS